MSKIDFDLNYRKEGVGSIPGPRIKGYFASLDDAIEAATKKVRATGGIYVVYTSSRRAPESRYRIAEGWKGHWRGERSVWISGNAIPGNYF